MPKLDDKVAIVTGAGSGIGRGTAILFAKEGAKVIIADNDRKGGVEASEIIKKDSIAEFIETDVTKEEDIKQMVSFTINRFGRIDILFNNAGIEISKSATETTQEEWDRMQDINLRAVFLGCKYAIHEMIKTGGGSIINTASVAAILAFPNHAAYCAAKAGVMMLTKQLALDYASKNIRVNCISPGGIDTPLLRRNFDESPNPKELEETIIKMCPIQRLGKPEDVAKAALFLASDDSSYVTGHSLVVDGGITIQIWPKE
jgi:NAD(P)-dependent dehydrogenase (short-subunit alcohol dehydrogenase family)